MTRSLIWVTSTAFWISIWFAGLCAIFTSIVFMTGWQAILTMLIGVIVVGLTSGME